MSATPLEDLEGFDVVDEHLDAEHLAENGSANVEDRSRNR